MGTSRRITRRGLLRLGAGAGALVAGVTGVTGFPFIAPTRARAQTLRARRDIFDLVQEDPNHRQIQAYRDAVTEMKRRSVADPNDPTGWSAQADIHSRRCPHGNWFFLPWHRGYLLAFEDICRQASGYPDFALPYWDWVKNPELPPPFLAGPLLDDTRNVLTDNRLPEGDGDGFLFRNFEQDIMSIPEFSLFGGELRGQTTATGVDWQKAGDGNVQLPTGAEPLSGSLERGPHNLVHRTIGGNMGDLLSPLDPIFWIHHCNVDRVWVRWRRCSNGGTGFANPIERTWQDHNFTFNGQADFFNPDKSPRAFRVRDLLTVNGLGYSYGAAGECAPITVVATAPAADTGGPVRSAGRARAAASAPAPRALPRLDANWRTKAQVVPVNREVMTSAPASVPLPTQGPSPAAGAPTSGRGRSAAPATRPAAANAKFQIPASGRIPSRVVATLRDVVTPADPDTVLRVFVGNKGANAQTPATDPSFVTTIAFFGNHAKPAAGMAAGGHAGHGGEHKLSYAVDITNALNRMKAAGRLPPGDIELQLVPVNVKAGGRGTRAAGAAPPKDAGVKVGRVEISGNRT